MLKSKSAFETCDWLGWRLSPISVPKREYMASSGGMDASPLQSYPRHFIRHNPFIDSELSERTLNATIMLHRLKLRLNFIPRLVLLLDLNNIATCRWVQMRSSYWNRSKWRAGWLWARETKNNEKSLHSTFDIIMPCRQIFVATKWRFSHEILIFLLGDLYHRLTIMRFKYLTLS